MKIRNAILAAALAMPALAGTEAPIIETVAPTPAAKKLSGSLTVGYDSNYTGRGYVVSHSVAEGDSVVYTALKTNYDIGKPGAWTIGNSIAYIIPTSGHTLYGNPTVGPTKAAQISAALQAGLLTGQPVSKEKAEAIAKNTRIGERNIENQFTVLTEAKYHSPSEKWNIAFGHNFTHGGLLGVMTKHYRKRGASCVNELFVTPEWTPHKAIATGIKTSYSVSGMSGWWFEPYVTAKAPIIGTPQDPTLVAMVTLGASFTYNYFRTSYSACGNGAQAYWIKLSTPWFVTDNFIITPSVSFNWLGNGGNDANRRSEVRAATENPTMIPFKNFGVVAGVSATYTF